MKVKTYSTEVEGLSAYYFYKGWFLVDASNAAFPVVQQPPAYSTTDQTSNFAPISVLNDWPENVDNLSIFPYLVETTETHSNPTFSHFVKTWYKSSCAILYCAKDAEPKIIGSGTFTEYGVSTARHNYEGIDQQNLFIRFFDYKVQRRENSNSEYAVFEYCLDIPVIQRYPSPHGIDMSYLEFARLQDAHIFNCFARKTKIGIVNEINGLSAGSYAMFHFAGGRHQVSVGNVKEYTAMANLNSNINIQAGPGASGATILWNNLSGIPEGMAISVYRCMEDEQIVRRLITYSEFNYPTILDSVNAPYQFDPNFRILNASDYDEPGYEFLQWSFSQHGKLRVNKPSKPCYEVVNKQMHATHHIIRIADMIFLWNYFHNLDEVRKNKIEQEVVDQASVLIGNEIYTQKQSIMQFYQPDEWAKKISEAEQAANNKYNYAWIENEIKTRLNNAIVQMYPHFIMLLIKLCPDDADLKNVNGFAWAPWNLFKGYNKNYRTDDPDQDGTFDFSEKNPPRSFKNKSLWIEIKRLNKNIQSLKTNKADQNREKAVFGSLFSVSKFWEEEKKKRAAPILEFDTNDWETSMFDDLKGHYKYRLKKI